MDTLGTILPQPTGLAEAEHRTEALERLRYLVHSGTNGLISGPSGTGKSWCLIELGRQLRREGIAVAQINLAAVTPEEFPRLICNRLGSGLTGNVGVYECWQWLHEYSSACRSSSRRLAILLDHLEHCDESLIAPLGRVVESFERSCAWIFSANESISPVWKGFLREQIWLRIELQNLAPRESLRILSRDMLQRGTAARFTPDGIKAVQDISQGRLRKLEQLAELAALASDADGVTQIDAEMVYALAAELAPLP